MQPDGSFLSGEDRIKVAIIAAMAGLDAFWIWTAGFTFDGASAIQLLVLFPLLLVIAKVYRRWRPNPVFVVMTKETAWLLGFTAAGALLSNLVVTLDLPPIDAQIAALDRAMGFDWLAYYGFLTAKPLLGLAASLVYVAALPLVAFAVITLSLMKRFDRAQELVLASMIGAIIAITVSGLLPTAGGLAWFRPEAVGLAHRPIVDLAYKQTFFDLRDGVMTHFSLDGIKGLIAFPSYHATLGVLVVLAFRGMPRFFWPLFVLIFALLLATPVEGGHHLADAVAGTAVAVISVAIAAAWRKRLAAETFMATGPQPAGLGLTRRLSSPSVPD
jgi:hypothetical protein